jgi:catechol 2,3-dioxygenase-like lactoylglutathione lyase family enzyme
MNPYINLITLGVQDLRKATDFYEKGLNFPRYELSEDSISFFNLKGTWLSLYPWDLLAQDVGIANKRQGFRGITLAHVVENEKKVQDVLCEAEQAGGRIIKPAKKADWGGFSGYFEDLDGYLWEVAYNPFFWPGPKN